MAETLQNGRFVLLGALGEGSQGRTFDAVDKREGRAVAIKRFDVRTAKTWKEAELAEREARVLQSLSHPRLPRYVDHFEEGGALYLVMEKIEGETGANLKARGGATEADVVRLLHDASDVLDYLQQRDPPIVHRDLKPGNVIRRPDGSFAFVDFGAVRDKLRPEGGSTVVGTFGYMAPEQFQGRALPASDVYAVGATAVALLAGSEPEALPHRGLGIDVRAALEGRASAGLVRVLEQMLDPDPDKRAARIAPLLAEIDAPAAPAWRAAAGGPVDWTEPWESLWHKVPEGFERQAREYERRAEELERLAAQGGPGAAGWRRGAEGWRKGAERWRDAATKMAQKEARRAERRARHRARHDAQRQMTRNLHAQHGFHGPGEVPPFVRVLFLVGLTVAAVAVRLSLRVVVPLVLTILALFFARRGLTRARARVRDAGARAVGALHGARRMVRDGHMVPGAAGAWRDANEDAGPGATRARVADAPDSVHARIVDPLVDENDDLLVEDAGERRPGAR